MHLKQKYYLAADTETENHCTKNIHCASNGSNIFVYCKVKLQSF